MCNTALQTLTNPAILMQIDSDEIWTSEQLTRIHKRLAQDRNINCAYFRCRYFVGKNIAITSRGKFGDYDYEWCRAWRVEAGARFATHEPPKLEGFIEKPWTKDVTEKAGLVFDHFAYASEAQVAFKEKFYGSTNNPKGHLYTGVTERWKKLQIAPMPVRDLAAYLPFVGPGVTADRVML